MAKLRIQGSSANYAGTKMTGKTTPSPSAKPYPAQQNAGMKISKRHTPSPPEKPYPATLRNAPKPRATAVLPKTVR